MSEIVYSVSGTSLAEGRTYQNPRYFAGPLPGAAKVYVVGDWPAIVDAYLAAGVLVIDNGAERAPPEPQIDDFGPLATEFAGVGQAVQPDEIEQPARDRRTRAQRQE